MLNNRSHVEPGDETREEHKTQAVFGVCTLEECSRHKCTAQTFGNIITRYGSTLYIGIAMVVPIPQYIRKCQFLLSVSSEFDF